MADLRTQAARDVRINRFVPAHPLYARYLTRSLPVKDINGIIYDHPKGTPVCVTDQTSF